VEVADLDRIRSFIGAAPTADVGCAQSSTYSKSIR
jgi:hypothetical protein